MMARFALLLLLLAGCGDRYFVNEAAETVPNLYLRDVRVTGGKTKLVFRYEADEACEIGVRPPGDPAAFVLRAGDRTWKLTGVSGIAELPAKTPVAARDSLRFVLEFEPLPEGVTELTVGEAGFDPGASGDTWRFGTVDLNGVNVVACP